MTTWHVIQSALTCFKVYKIIISIIYYDKYCINISINQ